jgi:hypothetical protein
MIGDPFEEMGHKDFDLFHNPKIYIRHLFMAFYLKAQFVSIPPNNQQLCLKHHLMARIHHNRKFG